MFIILLNVTCAEQVTGPPVVASVVLQSNVGNRLGVGRSATVIAVPRDAGGVEITGVTCVWSTSAVSVASVSGGLVTAASVGSATITATCGAESGSLLFTVSNPNFSGISATVAEPLMTTMVGALASAVRTRTQAALALCDDGVSTGNFTTIESCISSVRAEASSATDGSDRALLATISLLIDHIDRLLKL